MWFYSWVLGGDGDRWTDGHDVLRDWSCLPIFRQYPPFGSPQIRLSLLHDQMTEPWKQKREQSQDNSGTKPQHAAAATSLQKLIFNFDKFQSTFFKEKLEQSWKIILLTVYDCFVMTFIFREGIHASYHKSVSIL